MAPPTDAATLWAERTYQKDVPQDIARFRHLLESYSGIPPAEVDDHLLRIRDRAWAVARFPCLGRWSFTDLRLVDDPVFRSAVARLKDPRSGDALLDVACCLGQVVRQLVAEGVPPERLHGTDLSPAFLDLGFELFRDRARFPPGAFVAADLLQPDELHEVGEKATSSANAELSGSGPLRGKVTLVHAANFFHLFPWEEQVRAATRIVSFLQPGRTDAVVFGGQVGCPDPAQAEVEPGEGGPNRRRRRYLHNLASWQRLWDEVGRETDTRWRVEARFVGKLPFQIPGFPEECHYLKFAVYQT
ncbi:porphobilinogen deaminase protein [Purpureocillium lavendulum]|uniref:Porphobilinogen deaminase protein n=1 Tax=Purpureocillium lavendulum TaxID=1247861 RepID=A0AB34FRK0_9HYPO|nr:porphobilinogen deaminase protein [Purpureocillium lavendulum]